MNTDHKSDHTHLVTRERDHFWEMYLNLQTKLEAMKALEVNLRYEIYHLKEMHSRVQGKYKYLCPLCSSVDIRELKNILQDLKRILEEIQEKDLYTPSMSSFSNWSLDSLVQNNFFFYQEHLVAPLRKNIWKEFVIDMSESKDKNNLEENKAFKKEQDKTKTDSKQKETLDVGNDLAKTKPKERRHTLVEPANEHNKKRVTFQDIRDAEHIYSLPKRNTHLQSKNKVHKYMKKDDNILRENKQNPQQTETEKPPSTHQQSTTLQEKEAQSPSNHDQKIFTSSKEGKTLIRPISSSKNVKKERNILERLRDLFL